MKKQYILLAIALLSTTMISYTMQRSAQGNTLNFSISEDDFIVLLLTSLQDNGNLQKRKLLKEALFQPQKLSSTLAVQRTNDPNILKILDPINEQHWQCTECQEKRKLWRDMIYHLHKTHYRCTFCKNHNSINFLDNNDDLDQHKQKKHGFKGYTCSVCAQVFLNRSKFQNKQIHLCNTVNDAVKGNLQYNLKKRKFENYSDDSYSDDS